ncbi:MAG: DUF1538 family protein [Geobacteraceae bacterium]|nr:DUF1538 family protein [Geobacteraceae bacterium]
MACWNYDTRRFFLGGIRLFFGLWLLYVGLLKWIMMGPGTFVGYITAEFAKTWSPHILNVLLAWLIMTAEPVLAVLILSGRKARQVWTLTSLLMFLLTFGQTILMKPDVIANWQYLVLTLACAALSDPEPQDEGAATLTSLPPTAKEAAPRLRHISVSINRPPNEVYGFAANPENLPKWATGLGGSIREVDGEWIADAPLGKVKIRFAERNEFGVLDHDVILESGVKIHNPMRVVPSGDGSEVTFMLLRRQGVSEEEFFADAEWVEKDLRILKELLERSAKGT